MSVPTTEQIQTVRNNLSILRELHQEAYPHVLHRIDNAYKRLSEVDNVDPGMEVFLKLLEKGIGALGGQYGEIGDAVSSFVSGMVAKWFTDKPPNWKGDFARYADRYSQSNESIIRQLDYFNEHLDKTKFPPEVINQTWNTAFTHDGKTAAVSDLARGSLPQLETTEFDDMVAQYELQQDRAVWQYMLTETYYVPCYTHYYTDITDYNADTRPAMEEFYNDPKNKSAFCFTWWMPENREYGKAQWRLAAYWICQKNRWAWYLLSDDACDYLFKDTMPGHDFDPPRGLFTRLEVVDFLGVDRRNPWDHSAGTRLGIVGAVEGRRTVEGREAIEERIIQKAQQDAAFADKLAKNPKPALEEYFDIKVPDDVSVTVVLEDPKNLALVIRGAKRD